MLCASNDSEMPAPQGWGGVGWVRGHTFVNISIHIYIYLHTRIRLAKAGHTNKQKTLIEMRSVLLTMDFGKLEFLKWDLVFWVCFALCIYTYIYVYNHIIK